MEKRGEQTSKAASGAAVLIIIIGAILVFYVLFLPPDDRAILLGEENYTNENSQTTTSGYNKTLLNEKIGRLDYLKFDYREHDVPSFRIYSEKEATTISSAPSIYVRSAIGEKKSYNLSFKMKQRITSNVQLAFNIKNPKGRLEIYLNGYELFNGELSEGSHVPINLPSDLLKDENKLTFKVSKPGITFWRNNQYLLENVIITGKILDDSHSVSRQYFYLSEAEKINLETLKLKFYPTCTISEVGPMLIYLNGQEVFSGVADCGIYNSLYLDTNVATQDKNELEFVATEGSYLLDRISVKSELEELIYPVYYFDMEEDLFSADKLKNDFNVTIKFKFVNQDNKKVEYLINGRKRSIDTNELIFESTIDDYVVPETNSLELIPRSVIDIADLKVVLAED